MSRADRRRFEAHLSSCPHCTAYLAQMRSTIQITGQAQIGRVAIRSERRARIALQPVAQWLKLTTILLPDVRFTEGIQRGCEFRGHGRQPAARHSRGHA